VAASLQAPQLFLIAGDLSKMEILALVDESDIGQIEPGQEARFTVQAFPDRYFRGKVAQVRLQSTTQENVVNYLVAVSVDNEDGKLLPGMTATAEFIVKRAQDVFTVSNAALRFQPTEAMRAAVRERRQAMEVRPRTAERGAAADSAAGGSAGGLGGRDAGQGTQGARSTPARRSGGLGADRRVDRGVLWIVNADGNLDILPVKTGISDAQSTEISGPGLTEGLQVIAAVTTSAATEIRNPFEGTNPGGPGRRRPGF
jgi:HlyD family secretion protein